MYLIDTGPMDGCAALTVSISQHLIEGTFRLMRSAENRPVNIGNPQEHTVRKIAEMILEISGSESELVHEALPQDDPKRRCPDISRARKVLNWEPSVPAEEGLKLTFEWFAERLGPTEAVPPR
jgi:nucleoside-diphosphate-sugar epimerase